MTEVILDACRDASVSTVDIYYRNSS